MHAMRSSRWVRQMLAVGAAGVFVLAFGTAASADGERISRGDAQAGLESFGNGGSAIITHGRGEVHGAPAERDAFVRPLGPFDGRHYCALDWHTIVLAFVDGGDSSFSHSDAVESFSQIEFDFTLDGLPLETERTAVKPFLRDLSEIGITKAYYFQEGRVMSPTDLTTGPHTLSVDVTDQFGTFTLGPITFHIDAPKTGACV